MKRKTEREVLLALAYALRILYRGEPGAEAWWRMVHQEMLSDHGPDQCRLLAASCAESAAWSAR